MKTVWVLGYDRFYPSTDNFMKSFETHKEAKKFLSDLEERNNPDFHSYDNYEIMDISHRLY